MFNKRFAIAFLSVMAIASPVLSTQVVFAQNAQVSPVAPRVEEVTRIVTEAYQKYKGDNRGKNADYIPYLAKVDSNMFGIAIVTTDNRVIAVGDVKYSFSIQSIA